MIVLNEKENSTNFLHIIIGPETEFQFNLNGHSSIDISEYIKEVPKNEKFVVIINRCDSEDEVLRQLAFEQSKQHFQKTMHDSFKKITSMEQSNKQQEEDDDNADNIEETDRVLKCPKCGKSGYYKIINGIAETCESCKKLDSMLDKIPPPPSSDTLKQIREEIINDKKKKNKQSGEDLNG